jgi:SAM-dependent methyltransferase
LGSDDVGIVVNSRQFPKKRIGLKTPSFDEIRRGYVKDQKTWFDHSVTKEWDKYLNPKWNKSRKIEVEEIIKITGRNIKTVLDLGCGDGYRDLLIANLNFVDSVVGVDYSAKSIEKAEQYFGHPKIKRIAADIFDEKPFFPPRNKVDLVVSFQVIEHLENPDRFLEINNSCVKDGGYIAIVTPNWERLENRLRSALKLKYGFCDPLHYQEFSMSNLREGGNMMGWEFVGGFGHSLFFSLKNLTLLDWPRVFSFHDAPTLTRFSRVIGVVFRKKS